MGPIIEITGPELARFLNSLLRQDITSVRVAIDGGFKISVNQGMWTAPMGEARP